MANKNAMSKMAAIAAKELSLSPLMAGREQIKTEDSEG